MANPSGAWKLKDNHVEMVIYKEWRALYMLQSLFKVVVDQGSNLEINGQKPNSY